MATDEVPNRVRAARALAGFDSVEELAERLSMPGLAASTIRSIERGKRVLQPHERLAIADVTGVQPDFFTVERDTLGFPPDLLERSYFMRGRGHTEEDQQAAEMARYEAERALVQEFGVNAPGAAVMLRTVIDELADLRQELRETRGQLADFTKAWDEKALPAIGLIQAAAQERLDAEEAAAAKRETGEQPPGPAAQQAG